jgi:hypothetical protein
MNKNMVWGIALVGACAGIGVAYVSTSGDMGFLVSTLLYLVVLGGAGFASTRLTGASGSAGVLAGLVGAVVLAIGSYYVLASFANAVIAEELAKQAAANPTKDVMADQAAAAVGAGVGAMAGAVFAVKNFVFGFLFHMIGALVGRTKATGRGSA